MWNTKQMVQKCGCCSASHPTFTINDTGVGSEKIQMMYQHLAEFEAHNRRAREIQIERLKAEVARLQGKEAVLKHENNKLRRRVKAEVLSDDRTN